MKQLKSIKIQKDRARQSLDESVSMILGIDESFTRKISRKKNDELISKADTAFNIDGVYILHDTLGVKTVDGWNPKYNEGVVGILVIEDNHRIVVALENAPKNLLWSKNRNFKLVNQSIETKEDANSDFNGEEHCINLNSPDFPAAYYCLNYQKGCRKWHLPSSGELRMIYNHLDEIQNALSIVGGQKFVINRFEGMTEYWSSTELSDSMSWYLGIYFGEYGRGNKRKNFCKVRPVSKFGTSVLREPFTRKISRKKNDELISKSATDFEIPVGVYILHETLGVRGVDGWNPEDNEGVVGILLVEDDLQIVIALKDSPRNLRWSKKYELVNEPVGFKDVDFDFKGEEHCRNLNSPKFPAAYYCLNYKKGGRSWYLPSYGELRMILRHLDEIQNALETVGGQKFVFSKDNYWNSGSYWSSTESLIDSAWKWHFVYGTSIEYKDCIQKVRPVSKFGPSVLRESFTRKISSRKNTELISKTVETFIPDGVYILHDTLGVRIVDGWNPKDNEGVVGVLLIEDGHKIVIALEDAPKNLHWSKNCVSINKPLKKEEGFNSDFNGEYYCRKLVSPDFPAAYYCLNYKKGGRNWYLPSSGELLMIYNHLEEIQNTLETVGGQKFVTAWRVGMYWSSTEFSYFYACYLNFCMGFCGYYGTKQESIFRVRPVSKFEPSVLRESFTRKISRKKNNELISKTGVETFIPDGVYILHETLGVRTVDGWNPKNNQGVTGILLIEDNHKIVISLEDSPEDLLWSTKRELINEPVRYKDAESDFNGEYYCRNLNSPDFPAAYYCLNYQKGNRSWYLPSSGELWLIYNHLEEIQNALETVGGQKFVISKGNYWSSTELSEFRTWYLDIDFEDLNGNSKHIFRFKVRPVSKFGPSVLRESFNRKISSRKNTELISKAVETFISDGVYILHKTLGVRIVDGWNPEDNEGVVGILVIEDDHKIVVATEDAPDNLRWSASKKRKLINQPVEEIEDAESDFNGEYYCRKLNSPNYPAAYYCLNYNKGGRSWYLPSSGELWLICRHLEEIQNALETVGGQKFVTSWYDKYDRLPWYWSSTERGDPFAWHLNLQGGILCGWNSKFGEKIEVRPVSKFGPSTLKESFTKKISKKNGTEVIGRSERIFLEESIAQIVFSFGKNAMVPNNDKKPKFGYKLPFGCLPNFLEGSSNKVLDNGDVIKRTETRSLMGYTQTYEIIAVHIYFDSLSKKVYVGMKKPSSWSQYESFPKIYNLYGASSSGILELSDFSVDELRRICQNLQERTKFKKPLRKKIILKGEESF